MSVRSTVLITGGNAGIGRAAARQFLDAGHRVLLGCRDEGRGIAAVAQLRALDSRRDQMARAYTWAVTDTAALNGSYWDGPGRPATVSPWAANLSNQAALDELTRAATSWQLP